MLNTKSFLCLDFGAGSLKIAEFEPNESGTLRLKQFGLKPLGFEGSQEAARERVILKAIQELFAERPFNSKNINVCAPGFHVFSKFVKLPPVDISKVTQIIQYEAQQNVPFPLEEVVWDYQILGTAPAGELEVLLVAIKADVVDGLFRTAEAANLRVQLVDVSRRLCATPFATTTAIWTAAPCCSTLARRPATCCFSRKAKSIRAASTSAPTRSRRILRPSPN